MKALDLSAIYRHESKHDTDEVKTTWLLGALDTRIRMMLEDIAWEYETDPGKPGTTKAKASFNLGKSALELVAFGLKGFENFIDPKTGKMIEFKVEPRIVGNKQYFVVDDEIIKLIPGDVIKELAEKIKDINKIDEQERKN